MSVGRAANLAERSGKPVYTKIDEIKVQILSKGWKFTHKVALRKNEVQLYDRTWLPMPNTTETHEFFDFVGLESTLVFGVDLHMMDVKFYQHPTIGVHVRKSFTILELLAEVGGLAILLYMAVSFFLLPLASFGLSLSMI